MRSSSHVVVYRTFFSWVSKSFRPSLDLSLRRCVAASLRLFLLMFEVEEKLCFSSTNWRILLDSLLHLPYLRYVCS